MGQERPITFEHGSEKRGGSRIFKIVSSDIVFYIFTNLRD